MALNGIKKCPKCHKNMIQYAGADIGNVDSSLANKWKCQNCGYEETQSFFDAEIEKNKRNY